MEARQRKATAALRPAKRAMMKNATTVIGRKARTNSKELNNIAREILPTGQLGKPGMHRTIHHKQTDSPMCRIYFILLKSLMEIFNFANRTPWGVDGIGCSLAKICRR